MWKSLLLFIILAITGNSSVNAQKHTVSANNTKEKKAKPYTLQVIKEKINITAKKNIASCMVWNLQGHRVAEQRTINSSYTSIPVQAKGKLFFVMITFTDRDHFTEKIAMP